jgi:hypothetical protein
MPDPLEHAMCGVTPLARRAAVSRQNGVDEGTQWSDYRLCPCHQLALRRFGLRQRLPYHPPMHAQLVRHSFNRADPKLVFPANLLE